MQNFTPLASWDGCPFAQAMETFTISGMYAVSLALVVVLALAMHMTGRKAIRVMEERDRRP